MPFLEMDSTAGKKRKRTDKPSTKPSIVKRAEASDEASAEDDVLELEAQVLESRKHYNNIPKLLTLAKDGNIISDDTILPAIALCRIYCRLFANGSLSKSSADGDSEVVIAKWLKERLAEYVQLLCDSICEGSDEVQSTVLTLAMRLVKEEVIQDGYIQWQKGVFPKIMSALLSASEGARQAFCENNFSQFDDVRVFALNQITEILKQDSSQETVEASLEILTEIEEPSEDENDTNLFVEEAGKEVQSQISSRKQRKAVQNAWLAVLKCPLTKQQNKQILGILVHRIVPWFTKVELLMDYLTDSFNVGGATSLLALSGLFHLMQQRNLDYPSFYEKLYSLLDGDLLHSKHRSRFFRLLDIFMGSTHLPAALVASFIKRLSRLALHAPPAGIVVVVPWIYNMFKQHPQCTFMIQRQFSVDTRNNNDDDQEEGNPGFVDPFDATETDPLETGALESSIWEIETLQAHWHPNVATLAKIISEQFTKQSYNLEDFLDHSYGSLVAAEVAGNKPMKRSPVVEWEIPRHVFVAGDEEGADAKGALNEFGLLMQRVLDAC